MIKVQIGSVRANSLQTKRTAPLLLAGILAFGLGAAGHYAVPGDFVPVRNIASATAVPLVKQVVESVPVKTVATVAAEAENLASKTVTEAKHLTEAVEPAKAETFTRVVELGSGQTFAALLTDADVPQADALSVAAAMNEVYDHKRLKAGQEVTLSFTRLADEETLSGVVFQPEITKEVAITRKSSGAFAGSVKNMPLERQRMAVQAEIRGSFYESGERAGVPHAIMAALHRAYAHEIDFQRDLRKGDKFEVLYDQPMARDGTPVGQGVIIYAALEVAKKVKPIYRVTFGDGAVDYFDEKGQSIKRALLRTPLGVARVTSRFGMRIHPMLGYSKMHQGVDFGAPYGTPIFAAGSGVVQSIGFKGGYGRYILIKHNNRIETAYAHMSRFARNLYAGAKIKQGDVIGFVGSSGRSTGPHLHFEVHVNGRQANPLSINLPTGRVLEGKTLVQFKEGQKRIKTEFKGFLTEKNSSAKADKTEPVQKRAVKKAEPAQKVAPVETKVAFAVPRGR